MKKLKACSFLTCQIHDRERKYAPIVIHSTVDSAVLTSNLFITIFCIIQNHRHSKQDASHASNSKFTNGLNDFNQLHVASPKESH